MTVSVSLTALIQRVMSLQTVDRCKSQSWHADSKRFRPFLCEFDQKRFWPLHILNHMESVMLTLVPISSNVFNVYISQVDILLCIVATSILKPYTAIQTLIWTIFNLRTERLSASLNKRAILSLAGSKERLQVVRLLWLFWTSTDTPINNSAWEQCSGVSTEANNLIFYSVSKG